MTESQREPKQESDEGNSQAGGKERIQDDTREAGQEKY